jgi:hypothetical protein
MSQDQGRCHGCGSNNGCQGECETGQVIPSVVFSTSADQQKSSVDATLKELRTCQDKIRKMRHELRCITEAHQRTLFTLKDALKAEGYWKDKANTYQAAYYKANGYRQKGWLRTAVWELGIIFQRIAA